MYSLHVFVSALYVHARLCTCVVHWLGVGLSAVGVSPPVAARGATHLQVSARSEQASVSVSKWRTGRKEGGRWMVGWEESHQSPCGWEAGPGEWSPCEDLGLLSFLPAHDTQNNTCFSETQSERCAGGGRGVSSCPTTRRARMGIDCKFDKLVLLQTYLNTCTLIKRQIHTVAHQRHLGSLSFSPHSEALPTPDTSARPQVSAQPA